MGQGIKVYYFKCEDQSGKEVEYASCDVVKSFKVDSYRGEDSGAIYPVLETRTVESYNIASILDHVINNKTVRELIIESHRMYQYAGELHTSYQASSNGRHILPLPMITEGVCSQSIELLVEGDVILDAAFHGGGKNTSCPDQFAQLLNQIAK